jgi:hypothetical protein
MSKCNCSSQKPLPLPGFELGTADHWTSPPSYKSLFGILVSALGSFQYSPYYTTHYTLRYVAVYPRSVPYLQITKYKLLKLPSRPLNILCHKVLETSTLSKNVLKVIYVFRLSYIVRILFEQHFI